jgi:hypothetical protein
MRSGLPGGNNPNHLFAIFLVIDMRNQKHATTPATPNVCHRCSPSSILPKRLKE